MKKLEHLDHIFNEATARLAKGKNVRDPYEMGPLASDHLLLKKSWDYFHKRLMTIESQNAEIVELKDAKIKMLERTILELRNDCQQMQSKNKNVEELEREFLNSKSESFEKFMMDTRSHVQKFNEERIVLEERLTSSDWKVDELEKAMSQEKIRFKEIEKEIVGKNNKLQAALDSLNNERLDKEIENQKKFADLSDEVLSRVGQIDLLKAEIEQRDQAIQRLCEDKSEMSAKNVDLDGTISQLKIDMLEREDKIKILEENLGYSEKELKMLKEHWGKEEAQWRELWDRNREMWDENKKNDKVKE